MKIITNNVPRNLIYGYELTEAEKADFDYIDDINTHDFFRYRGCLYDPSEFMHWDNPASPTRKSVWQGYQSDSYFSGVVIRYTDDFEQVVCGTYLS